MNCVFLWKGTDPEDVIKNAFGCFDEDNVGMIHEDRLRELLTTIGDRFTDDEVDEMYKEAPIQKGMFDYNEFTKILKHGAKEKDEPWRSGWRIVDLLSLVPFLRELDFLKLIL